MVKIRKNLHVSDFVETSAVELSVTRIVQTEALLDLLWTASQISHFQALSEARMWKQEVSSFIIDRLLIFSFTYC